MRSLRLSLLAIGLLAAAPLAAQNYRTSVTIGSLLSGSTSVANASVCATAVDIYGNPIGISASTWGLILKNTPICGTVTTGILSGLTVPDANNTRSAAPILYNFSIQVLDSGNHAVGQPVTIPQVSGVTGLTFALDSYVPPATVPTPSPIVGYGATPPATCTSPAIWLDSGSTAAYRCYSGTFVLLAGTGGPPSGSAGGDLGGTYPNPNVVKVNGAAVPVSVSLLGSDSAGHLVTGAGSISQALTTGAGMYIGGDSICAGTGASNIFTNAFAFLLRPIVGGFWNATCRPGDQLIDTTSTYVNTLMAPANDGHYPATMIEDGTNDVTNYNSSANLQTTWQAMYLADIATAGIAFAQKSYPALSLTGWTASTGWANDTTQNSLEADYVSSTNGNTLAYTTTCAAACVGILDYPVWNGNGGTFTVSVDGTLATVPYGGGGTTFYAAGFNAASITATSSTASTFTKATVRLPMAAGTHTITVAVTSPTLAANKVGVNWFAIVPTVSTTNPNVEAISIQHRNDANDALSGTYSGYISAIATQAATDGMNVSYANVRDSMLNTNVAVNLYVAETGTSYVAPLWVSGTQVAYAQSGQILALVGSAPAQGQYSLSAGTYTFNVADANTPLLIGFTTNCGATTAAMFTNCYADALHPNDLGHAVYAATIAAALPARLVTGNNIPQSTYPYRNYVGKNQLPSQMMTPLTVSLSNSLALTGPGFRPGINWNCSVGECWFETLIAGGNLATIVPNAGSAVTWSINTYNSGAVQPSSESQIVPLLTLNGQGVFTSYAVQSTFNAEITLNQGANNRPSYSAGLFNISDNVYFYPLTPTVGLSNTNTGGTVGIRYEGTGTGAISIETGVGNSAVNSGGGVCAVTNLWYMGDYTSGTCVLRETMGAGGAHKFLAGLAKQIYTVATLPAASSVAAGTEFTVSDATSVAPGTCAGGSTNYVTAISNGTNWICP